MSAATVLRFDSIGARSTSCTDVRTAALVTPLREAETNADIGSIVSYRAKEAIYFEGDPAGRVFEITAGIVKLFKLTADGRCQVTGFLYPGQYFGFERNDEHSQTAEALTSTTLRSFTLAKLERLAGRDPAVQQQLLEAVRSQLLSTQDHLLLLGRKTAQEKLSSFLLRISEVVAGSGGDGSRFEIPMSRTEIADYLGLTTETVSRCFSRLKDRGLLSFTDARHITIRDIDRLLALSEEDEGTFAH